MTQRAYHHGNVRGAALNAALEIVRTHGADALTLRRVARSAEVSHTAVGREFGGLPGLLAACAGHVFLALAHDLRAAGDPETPALARFRAQGLAYIAFATRHAAWMQVLGHPTVLASEDPTLATARAAPRAALFDAVMACIDAGEIRAANPEDVALHVWTAVHGFAVLSGSAMTPQPLDGAAAERLMDQLYMGMRPD